jgi:glycosyltransferase involved in cell wall biosynthesis
MPAYNEEEIVGYTVRRLVNTFRHSGYRLQLVVVDNGSQDRTGEIIREIAATTPAVTPHRVEVNQGYGYGVTSGFPLCTAPWIGWIPADAQVDAEDVVRLFECIATTKGPVLAKVRRRFRMDGWLRQVISFCYNTFVRILWPGLAASDVNAVPKILPRQTLAALSIQATGWALDPEVVVKAHHLGLRILEFNVLSRERSSGLSHVRAGTCWELFASLLRLRFSNRDRETTMATQLLHGATPDRGSS